MAPCIATWKFFNIIIIVPSAYGRERKRYWACSRLKWRKLDRAKEKKKIGESMCVFIVVSRLIHVLNECQQVTLPENHQVILM